MSSHHQPGSSHSPCRSLPYLGVGFADALAHHPELPYDLDLPLPSRTRRTPFHALPGLVFGASTSPRVMKATTRGMPFLPLTALGVLGPYTPTESPKVESPLSVLGHSTPPNAHVARECAVQSDPVHSANSPHVHDARPFTLAASPVASDTSRVRRSHTVPRHTRSALGNYQARSPNGRPKRSCPLTLRAHAMHAMRHASLSTRCAPHAAPVDRGFPHTWYV